MLNPNPDKAFEDYKKQINKEAFYRNLKHSFSIRFNSAIEKTLNLGIAIFSVAYVFAVAYIVVHFVVKFW